jgi:hypothetical protein
MTSTFPITIDLSEFPAARADEEALTAAIVAARQLPLYISPNETPESNDLDFYKVVADTALMVHEATIAKAEADLSVWDELTDKHWPRPADVEPPTDAACSRYMFEIDAAYFLGIVMGARLARLTGADGGGR